MNLVVSLSRLVFYKCRQVRHRSDWLKSCLGVCLFGVSTKPPSKFSQILNGLVRISKYFELLRVFKPINLIVGEKAIQCGLLASPTWGG